MLSVQSIGVYFVFLLTILGNNIAVLCKFCRLLYFILSLQVEDIID